jgi:hypothetical protein
MIVQVERRVRKIVSLARISRLIILLLMEMREILIGMISLRLIHLQVKMEMMILVITVENRKVEIKKMISQVKIYDDEEIN